MIPLPPLYLPQKRDLLWVQLPTRDFPFNLTFYIKATVLSAPLKQHNAISSCSKKGNSGYVEHQGKFSTFFTLAVEVSKSIGLIAKAFKNASGKGSTPWRSLVNYFLGVKDQPHCRILYPAFLMQKFEFLHQSKEYNYTVIPRLTIMKVEFF